MKTLVIGDLHGLNVWKSVIEYEKPDKVVFLGDYFDSFHIKCEDQINNFLDLVALKESGLMEVVLLIGNHDVHYLPYIKDTMTAGFQTKYKFMLNGVLDKNKHHLSIAHRIGNILMTHAGIGLEFLNKNLPDWNSENLVDLLEDLFKYKPNAFLFNGSDPYGDDTCQTPLWIRPKSLMSVNKGSELHKKFVQVFGHTQVVKVDTKGHSTGKKYYNLDAMASSGEYMILDKYNLMTFNTYKNYLEK